MLTVTIRIRPVDSGLIMPIIQTNAESYNHITCEDHINSKIWIITENIICNAAKYLPDLLHDKGGQEIPSIVAL